MRQVKIVATLRKKKKNSSSVFSIATTAWSVALWLAILVYGKEKGDINKYKI
jgi:hypothetical protein